MQAVYHLKINELTNDFIKMLKTQYQTGILDIVVSESDDTDYLLSSKTNEELLDQAIFEIENKDVLKKNLKDLGI
ncbi:MAG: hypothetical protein PF693_02050 [Spirochaetia bacterium]|jgi:hypothetical protein|nr:hypothetical protein [Spirochaetia bacterium]